MNISIDMIENENGVNFTVTDIWNAETLEDFDSDVDNVVYELARIMREYKGANIVLNSANCEL